MEKLSKQAQECLKYWQKQIDETGMASLLADGPVAQELLKSGFVEKSPLGGAFQCITCDECEKIICECK